MKKKTKKEYKKRRRVGDLLRILILFVALSVLLYPTVSNYLYEKNSARVITSYDEKAVEYSEKEQKQMLEDARAYNEEMLENVELLDPFSTEKKEVNQRYQSLLNVDGSGMMGYITIPKINVELPVYHGTSESVLQAGVGHMEGTSLPVGGESTHAVLTGHRGLPSKLLFTDLDEMEVRDIFYIKVLGETFAYQVDQILTVLPSETDALRIEQGKDYVTLVTCTPYAVNTHRLLVRGHRVPYEETVVAEEEGEPQVSITTRIMEMDFDTENKLTGAVKAGTSGSETLKVTTNVIPDDFSLKLTPKNIGSTGIKARRTHISFRPGSSEEEGHYVDVTFKILACEDGELYTKFKVAAADWAAAD